MRRFFSGAMGMAAMLGAASAFAEDGASPPVSDAPLAEPAAHTPSPAAPKPDHRVSIGLRSGYGLPMGDSYPVSGSPFGAAGRLLIPETKLRDRVSDQIPIWIDAGYLVTPAILVGLYGQYGFLSVKNCPADATCSVHDIRVGVQGQYHFKLTESVDPWLGVGVGYEWLSQSTSEYGLNNYGTLSGTEYLNLQGGFDFKVVNALALGPFLSISVGKFSNLSTGEPSDGIPSIGMHEWLTLGIKGSYGI